jgi:large subunit ribosomal protein L2
MNFNKNKRIKKLTDIGFLNFRKFIKTKTNLFANTSLKKFSLKKLIIKKNKSLGRSYGKIVSWHRGGGLKNNYRNIFFNKNLEQSYGILRSIEYDPNRSVYIGVIQCQDGSFCYMPVSSLMKINDVISFSHEYQLFKLGDSLKLRYVPVGIPVYNLEKYPGSGPIYSKAAGVSSLLLTKGIDYGTVKLPSGEERMFDLECNVTIGMPSNIYRKFQKKYKAGTNRLLNKRPTVRGVAMNPIDHPHGGGAGKTTSGRPKVSP